MALVYVYDALRRARVCARVYKSAMSHAQAIEIIVAGRGKHFDPAVIDAFLRSEAMFAEIAATFAHPDKAAAHAAP